MPDRNHHLNGAPEHEPQWPANAPTPISPPPPNYQDLHNNYQTEYNPQTGIGQRLMHEAVQAHWSAITARQDFRRVQANLPTDPLSWTPEHHKQIAQFSKYQTTAERHYRTAFNAIENFRKSRLRERNQRQTAELRLMNFELRAQHMQQRELNQAEDRAERKQRQANEEARKAEREQEAKESPSNNTTTKKPSGTEPEPTKLDQWIDVNVIDGKTVSTYHPPNEQLLAEALAMNAPPDRVYRRINFLCPPPAEYAWTAPPPKNAAIGGFGNQRMTWTNWLAAIEREKLTGHAGPSDEPNLPRIKKRKKANRK